MPPASSRRTWSCWKPSSRTNDNLSYGAIISVYTGPDEAITALTDHGLEELADMLREARRSTKTWHEFLDDFVDDPELAARLKSQAR